ncbi:MAG: hypothetical protein KAI47_27425 [Deltaproteobacteria bacterium]|nr:hypothetical protein [Deltaproteobacteria bacterium]
MTLHRSHLLVLIVALVAPMLVASFALAEPTQIKAPIYRGKVRARQIRRGRAQRFSPRERQALVHELKGMGVNSPAFQKKISVAPLQARMEIFKAIATETGGVAPTTFTRRLRGMLKQHGKNRVAKPSKSFVEVTNGNFELFQKTMGKNVIWFAVNSSPGHLHTLIHDQNNGGTFYHNTYGQGTLTNKATITGYYTQYALPVVLTDAEMKRFTSYMNAGLKEHQHGDKPDHGVYGFYSRGKKITNIACTNWVTPASIGKLPRWAKTIDKRLVKMAAAGEVNVPKAVAKKGLYKALVSLKTVKARKQLVAAVLGNHLSKWNRSAVKRMAKAFEKEAKDFKDKPQELLMRDALAKTLGLGRSQDPAKWAYDLLMSKKVPVVAILNGQPKATQDMEINMEIMGVIGKDGWVSRHNFNGYGIYSSDRADVGGIGVVPEGRSTAVRPAPASAE